MFSPKGKGALYVVSTPIGNLKDITLRAIEVLKSVDLILAESPSHTLVLLQFYGIDTKVRKLNQHSKTKEITRYIRALEEGSNIAYVSNAGTPAISDPGNLLVREALKADLRVVPVPGASAVTAALSVSGMPSDGFVFLGFLSPKRGRRKKELAEVSNQKRPIVIFESCHRIQESLQDMLEVLGNREVVMLREATKLYEEVRFTDLEQLKAQVSEEGLKGEITLVIRGKESLKGSNSWDGKDQEG